MNFSEIEEMNEKIAGKSRGAVSKLLISHLLSAL